MIDWFLASHATPVEGLPEEAKRLALRKAEAFLRAGGRISWGEWSSLSEESQEILAAAGDRIAIERAALAGAATNPAAAQAMTDTLDGGRAKIERTLIGTVERAVYKMEHPSPV
jgi:hypothetical protein